MLQNEFAADIKKSTANLLVHLLKNCLVKAARCQSLRGVRHMRPAITEHRVLFTSQNLETTDPSWIWQQLSIHSSPEIRDFPARKPAVSKCV